MIAQSTIDLVNQLRIRANIRRNATDRRSVIEGKPDRISTLLEQATDQLELLSSLIQGKVFDYDEGGEKEDYDYSEKVLQGLDDFSVIDDDSKIKEAIKQIHYWRESYYLEQTFSTWNRESLAEVTRLNSELEDKLESLLNAKGK